MQLNVNQLNGAPSDQALLVAEEFYKRALGSTEPPHLNKAQEIAGSGYEAFINKFSFPSFFDPVSH
jgi:hypothetical protein